MPTAEQPRLADSLVEQSTSLASRLRTAREASNLTQAQAAAELGVSRPLLIAIEKGTRKASPHELARLAEIYQTSLNRLLRPAHPPAAIAARLYAAGDITETQLAHYLHTDIVGARRAYAQLSETIQASTVLPIS